ncbi:hypothetical protein JZ751_001199 [Albula glossodonta]|uniref:G-protein coupled receptors family 1 profile domain-containing protein n=1 Tax=Albula glossodonta TaxID=121402 RepID=A0A8T2PT28_9TELE|nr:hypothetical protein JZ751_001199 [Albula glossodonta]
MDAVSKTGSQAPETSLPGVEFKHTGVPWDISGQQPAGEVRADPRLEEEWQDCQEGLRHRDGGRHHAYGLSSLFGTGYLSSFLKSCEPEAQHISIAVFLWLLFLGGFVLSCFSLWVFWFRMRNWGPGATLQFHLALSDAIVTPATPLMATYIAMGSVWRFGHFLCQLKIALLSMHFFGSILFLTLISIHRYVAVVRYNRPSAMKRVAFVRKLCGAIWLLLLAEGASCFVFLGTSQVGNRTQCASIHQREYVEVYSIISFVLLPSFLVPFSIAAVFYCRLATSVSRIKSNSNKGQAIKAKSLKMVALCLLIFAVCFAPLNATRTMGVVVKKFYPERCGLLLRVETGYYISWILACSNCCFDPLLYFFGSPDFTKAVYRSFRGFGFKFEETGVKNETNNQNIAIQSVPTTILDIEVILKIDDMMVSSTLTINCTFSESCEPDSQHITISFFLFLLFAGGTLLNCFSLWVFWFRMPKWGPGTTLQFHLALSDSIVTPTTPVMAMYFAMGNCWPFGRFLCQLKIALLSIHFYGSILFLTLISIHRYVAVVRHNRPSAMKRVAFVRKLCGATWLLLLVLGASCFGLLGTSTVGNRTQCLSIHQGEYINVYFIINFILLFLAFLPPFSIAAVFYCRLATSVSRIKSNSNKGQAIKAKSLKMVALCLLIFAVCFAPLNATRTMGVVVKKFYPERCGLLLRVETGYYISWILACSNCCFDPLLYCFGSPSFTKAMRHSVRRFGLTFQETHAQKGLDCQNVTTQVMQSTTLDKETASTSSR